MKLLAVPALRLTATTLPDALDAVFGQDTLRRVHGPSVTGAFDFGPDGRRAFDFEVDVSAVPAPIRCFFCGPRLRVTTAQTLARPEPSACWRVSNSIRMHFVGSELFRIRPEFELTRHEDGRIVVAGTVRHDASLPPPLSGIAERFMAAHSERELRRFARELRLTGAAAAE